jgi:hypothetical protein
MAKHHIKSVRLDDELLAKFNLLREDNQVDDFPKFVRTMIRETWKQYINDYKPGSQATIRKILKERIRVIRTIRTHLKKKP